MRNYLASKLWLASPYVAVVHVLVDNYCIYSFWVNSPGGFEAIYVKKRKVVQLVKVLNFQSIDQSIHPSIHPFIHPPTHPSTHPSYPNNIRHDPHHPPSLLIPLITIHPPVMILAMILIIHHHHTFIINIPTFMIVTSNSTALINPYHY